jgi:hypothetical protein
MLMALVSPSARSGALLDKLASITEEGGGGST